MNYAFAKHTLGIHGKRVQVRNQENINIDSTQTNRRKAHLTCKLGPNTHVATLQDRSTAHHAKAVARGLGQGVADPRGRATPHRRLSATPSSGGGMGACRGGGDRDFVAKIASTPPYSHI